MPDVAETQEYMRQLRGFATVEDMLRDDAEHAEERESKSAGFPRQYGMPAEPGEAGDGG